MLYKNVFEKRAKLLPLSGQHSDRENFHNIFNKNTQPFGFDR